jgi:hypothetical protein
MEAAQSARQVVVWDEQRRDRVWRRRVHSGSLSPPAARPTRRTSLRAPRARSRRAVRRRARSPGRKAADPHHPSGRLLWGLATLRSAGVPSQLLRRACFATGWLEARLWDEIAAASNAGRDR